MSKPQLWILIQEMLKPVSTALWCQVFVVGKPIPGFRFILFLAAPCWVMMCSDHSLHSYPFTDSLTDSPTDSV